MPAKITRQGAPWTLAEWKQLGKIPDSVLARRTGRTIREVVAMRESRRIGLVTGPRRWTAREIRLLGTMPDLEVARRLRRSADAVESQRTELKSAIFKPRSPAMKRMRTPEARWPGGVSSVAFCQRAAGLQPAEASAM